MTNVKDLKTDKELKSENGYLKLDENKKDIYYKGDTDKKLPVDVSVKYFLDGKEMKASELEGKSGHLKIVITSKNNRDYPIKELTFYAKGFIIVTDSYRGVAF